MSSRDSLDAFPDEGRLAGIDYGTVRVGVAVCDGLRMIASPMQSYHRVNAERDAAFFKNLAREEQLVGFVVGLPLHTDGNESQKSTEARKFGEWLRMLTGLPVCFHDERYSTREAEQIMAQGQLTEKKRKQTVDMIAAQIVLQSYLEAAPANRGRDPGGLE